MSPSSFTWLQFDEEHARRARELVRALSEPGTLDSLGIGTIRDGFANIFFPGTSTIQTRARYFLLAPWAFQHVQASRPPTRALYDKRLRDVEVATIRALKTTQAVSSGIIGVEREERTRNLASTIYWSGTAAWGIRVAADFTRSDVREATLNQRQDHRDEADKRSPLIIWDDLPSAPDGFPNAPLAIIPTTDEADYLLSKMATTRSRTVSEKVRNEPGRSTLLATVARSPQVADTDYIWDLPSALLTGEQADLVALAYGFSTVVQGARLRYLDLLFARKESLTGERHAGHDDLDAHIAEWLEEMAHDSVRVRKWHERLPEMFDMLSDHGVTIRPSTSDFVTTWAMAAVDDPQAAMTSTKLADLITERESRLKQTSARLTNDSPLHAWNGELLGIDRLDFRWGVARRHILDCLEGKEGDHAQP